MIDKGWKFARAGGFLSSILNSTDNLPICDSIELPVLAKKETIFLNGVIGIIKVFTCNFK